MGTSRKAFTQVRDILRKIDRSIDDARSRRLGVRPEHAPQEREAHAPADQPEGAPRKAQRRAQPRRFDDENAFGNGASSQ